MKFAFLMAGNCDYNNLPAIKGPFATKVCEGDKICFSVYGTDETFTPFQTVPDTVTLRWNGGIPGASFKIKNPKDREKEAEFCWQTKLGEASDVPYSFNASANDNHCNKPGNSFSGFKIKVNQRAFNHRRYRCIGDSLLVFESLLGPSFEGTSAQKWSFRDSNGNNESYFSKKQKDTLRIKQWERHIMVHTINNSMNCPTLYRDTVECRNAILPIKILSKKDQLIFPNPVHRGEELNIKIAGCKTIEFLDINGRWVTQTEIIQNTAKVPPTLAPGLYQLRLCGDKNMSAKLMVLE